MCSAYNAGFSLYLVSGMKFDWITFWIAALACYRVTVFIVRDRGPFGVFARLRKVKLLSKFLKCPFCVSPYIGAVTAFGLWLAGYALSWSMWIFIAAAFSSVTIALDRTFSSDIVND
jgi:hypothetical protein